MDCKLNLECSDDLLMRRIRWHRAELTRLAEQYNYNFQQPLVLEASRILDTLLNLYDRNYNSKFIRASDIKSE